MADQRAIADLSSLSSQRTLRMGGASVSSGPSLGRIDHYDLLRKLGGGGFGVVYLARDSVSGIEVALKTLHPLLKTNAEEMDALREKFRLVHGLTHPNIAKALVLHPVHDVNIWDETARKEMRLSPGDSVMVMDYAPGVTLSRWRRQFPDGIVPPDLALEIGRQLASALDYAHSECVVHRDIKPGNIMVETLRADEPREAPDHEVEEQGGINTGRARSPSAPPSVSSVCSVIGKQCVRVRLLDFGLAAEIRSSMSRVSAETGDTSGTRPYMAPEQWLGKKQDGRTDQYALACVLYELLSGAPPFAGVFETGDPVIMMATVKGEAPDEIENVAPAINAALHRALSKAPKERFPSCAAFIEALSSETRNPASGRARSPSAPPSATKIRRARWIAAAVAVAVAGLAAMWFGRGQPPGGPSSGEKTHEESAAADVREDWDADNGLAREELGGLEPAVAEAATACEKAEGGRYAKAAIYRAQTTRDEAVRLRDRGEFAKAKERFESAKTQYESALASARSALAAAKVKESLVDAEAAKIREDWDAVLAAADKALEWESGNADAQKLKQEAEANLRPILAVSATLGGVAVSGATLRAGKAVYDLPKRIDCSKVRAFGPGEVTLEKDGKTYVGTLPQASIDWKGERPAVVALEERKGPKPEEPIDLGGGVKLEMVHCPDIAPDFWMGKVEVTQEQWRRVMGNNPSLFKNKPKNPVENVSWNDCQEFVKKLNALPAARASGLTFRLPTEEEWETACRAGAPASADFCKLADGTQITASTLSRVVRFDKGWDDGPVAVGSFQPNAWGLCDMHGNVWEWTSSEVGGHRVNRGGSFNSSAGLCTAGYRCWNFPGDSFGNLGLRLAASGRTAAQ